MTKEEIKKRISVISNIVIILFMIFAICCSLFGICFLCKQYASKQEQNSKITPQVVTGLDFDETASSEYEEAVSVLSNRNVYFAGIADATINEDTKVYLENLAENEDIYMMYSIEDADSGKVVFESDLIPSGTHITWEASNDLHLGDNHLVIKEVPYLPVSNGYIPLTVGQNTVTLTLVQ